MYPWSLRCFVCWRNDTFIGTQPNALQQYSSLHIPTAHLIYMYRIELSLDLTFHLTFHVTLGAMPRNMTPLYAALKHNTCTRLCCVCLVAGTTTKASTRRRPSRWWRTSTLSSPAVRSCPSSTRTLTRRSRWRLWTTSSTRIPSTTACPRIRLNPPLYLAGQCWYLRECQCTCCACMCVRGDPIFLWDHLPFGPCIVLLMLALNVNALSKCC